MWRSSKHCSIEVLMSMHKVESTGQRYRRQPAPRALDLYKFYWIKEQMLTLVVGNMAQLFKQHPSMALRRSSRFYLITGQILTLKEASSVPLFKLLLAL